MSAPFIIPFNNQPVSASVKTSSYTIPSGKYALVKTLTPRLSIDGVDINPLRTVTGSVPNSTSVTVNYDLSIETNTSLISTANFSTSGTGTYINVFSGGYVLFSASASSTFITNGAHFGNIRVQMGQTTTGNRSYSFSLNFYPEISSQTSFWVNSGTVINGASYVVEEFNVIS